MSNRPLERPCPVCGYPFSFLFFDGGSEPLATLGWPKSKDEAQRMPRFRIFFVMCPNCNHLWNPEFEYKNIPYSSSPNRMFNSGKIWSGHLENVLNTVIENLEENSKVIEIGCGEGHFLRALSGRKRGNYIGFDPNGQVNNEEKFEFFSRYYEPYDDTLKFKPDLIIMRHVLEHISNPSQFIGSIAWAAMEAQKEIKALFEVPCIDRVFTSKRLSDFFYEHPQQFTSNSFRVLLERFGEILMLKKSYNNEVVYGLVKLNISNRLIKGEEKARKFYEGVEKSINSIKAQLSQIAESKKKVVIWGGTGKAAAFMNHYGADAERFPIVVDSDIEKVGTYVPGTGQKIQSSEILVNQHVDIIIIPTQWRAREILNEIESKGIVVDKILIEHNGKLIDFLKEKHFY